jgi:hypothetical protein
VTVSGLVHESSRHAVGRVLRQSSFEFKKELVLPP